MVNRHMRDEAGVVSTFAIIVGSLLAVVSLAILYVTAIVSDRHDVAAAADLAAIAGTSAVLAGEEPCAAAQHIARRNGARLTTCRADLAVVTVTATTLRAQWWITRWRPRIKARAAPSSYLPGGSEP